MVGVNMQETEKSLSIGNKIITSISISKEQLDVLNLISLGSENSRSEVINRLLTECNNIEEIITTIAQRIVANYSESNIDFESFIKAAGSWLAQKKISAYHSERILEEAKKLHAA